MNLKGYIFQNKIKLVNGSYFNNITKVITLYIYYFVQLLQNIFLYVEKNKSHLFNLYVSPCKYKLIYV